MRQTEQKGAGGGEEEAIVSQRCNTLTGREMMMRLGDQIKSERPQLADSAEE